MALCVASLFKRGLGQLERVISFGSSEFFTPFSGRSQIIFQSIRTKFISAVSKDFKRMQGSRENDLGGSTWYKVCDFEKVLIALIL